MRLDRTDLASADGATNRTSLLLLRSRPRLVPEKYFPAGFAHRRPDAGGHVRLRIRKTLLLDGASDGVESSANIYKRLSTSTLPIQNRSTVLHASFEKTKMGSIEIYGQKNNTISEVELQSTFIATAYHLPAVVEIFPIIRWA
jgi:hypothetical protein